MFEIFTDGEIEHGHEITMQWLCMNATKVTSFPRSHPIECFAHETNGLDQPPFVFRKVKNHSITMYDASNFDQVM